MVHLYALADHPAQLPGVPGIGASPLAAAAVDAIDAVFSDVDGGWTEPTEAAILTHAHVVEELAKINDAVLPARLAKPYADEAALLGGIRERAVQLRDALARVRGCAEMGVRVVRHENHEHAPTASGSDYMRTRLEAIRTADGVAEELDAAVHGLARDVIRGAAGMRDLVLTVAYLVPKEDAGRLRAAVEHLAGAHPELTYVCVGPWPPYSFALVDGES
jgi:hypothetical protein